MLLAIVILAVAVQASPAELAARHWAAGRVPAASSAAAALLPSLESTMYILRMDALSREDVLANLNSLMLPVAGVSPSDAINIQSLEQEAVSSFEWFSSSVHGSSYHWLLTEKVEGAFNMVLVSSSSPKHLGSAEHQVLRTSAGELKKHHFALQQSAMSEKELCLFLDTIRFAASEKLNGDIAKAKVTGKKRIIPAITALAGGISAISSAWTGFVSAFKSSKSVTIERIVSLGFQSYMQKSQLLKAFGVPKEKVPQFISAVSTAMGLPSDPELQAVFLAMEYSRTFQWTQDEFVYAEKAKNNKATTLLVYKLGDDEKDEATFLYVKVQSDFEIADDTLITTTAKSSLGGLFSSTKQKISRIPHQLTLKEAEQLQMFFRVIAIGKLAADLGIEYQWPQIP